MNVRAVSPYPPLEPYETGALDVGDGNVVYWETSGNPAGRPAVFFHGGPGSGASAYFRRLFDPAAYRIVLFDQRNCGRSRPHASDPATDLSANRTPDLLRDIERIRTHLAIDTWLVLAGSWGCTLALAYAETNPGRVSAMVLFGVTTGRRSEVEWAFRGGLARFFPEQWDRLVSAVEPKEPDRDVVDTYARLLGDPDPDVRNAAATAWCTWESATPHRPPRSGLDPRFRDPDYALAFARIVTHYAKHDLWLEDGELLRGAGALARIPGVLVNGRFDFQAPISNAWELKRAWPEAELVIVEDAGHGTEGGIEPELVRATDRFR